MDIETLAKCCKRHLDLQSAKFNDEYYYNSLPFCVIDAVFSIGIRYTITRNVVINFCNKLKVERLREYGSTYPPIERQLSIQALLDLHAQYSIDDVTDIFYGSRNRTSSRNGILKSEAVCRFCTVLKEHGVNYYQDLPNLIGNVTFENSIKDIPGQKSGLSLNYFYMLSGDDNFIKADRMIIRFIKSCIDRTVNAYEASSLIKGAHELLVREFPNLTPRLMDQEIWEYQRNI